MILRILLIFFSILIPTTAYTGFGLHTYGKKSNIKSLTNELHQNQINALNAEKDSTQYIRTLHKKIHTLQKKAIGPKKLLTIVGLTAIASFAAMYTIMRHCTEK